MKKTVLLLAVAAALGASRTRGAEEADERVIVALKLRHVAPSTMARWLAPIQTFDPAAGRVKLVGEPLADTMLPNDDGHELWARTTPAQEDKLRQMVAALDALPQRAQLEVQAARVAASDLADLVTLVPHIALAPHADAVKPSMLVLSAPFVRSESYRSTLANMAASGHATLLLHTSFEAVDRKLCTLWAEEPPQAADGLQGEVTPIINEDSIINLKMRFQGGAQKAQADLYAVVRDGSTMALVLRDEDEASARATVIFITARLPRPGAAG